MRINKAWIMAAALIAVAAGIGGGAAAFADEDDARYRPAAGRDVVKPARPDWCEHADIDDSLRDDRGSAALGIVERNVDDGYGDKSLRQIAQLACARPDDAGYQAAVARWRQGYVNLTGVSEAGNRAAMKARVAANWPTMKAEYCAAIQPGPEDSPRARSFTEALAMGSGCEVNGRGGNALGVFADGNNGELGWWLDERAEVASELVRAVYVNRCLRVLDRKSDHSDRDWPDPMNPWVMQGYATCGGDARRLDRAKLEKELAQPKYNEFARVNARETFALAQATAAHLTRAYRELAARDEAYRRLLFDAPEAGWKAWEAAYADHRDAFEAARAYEERVYGPSRKALLGCGETLRNGFNAYLRGRHPASAAEARRAALDDIGYVLFANLAVCDAAEGRLELARAAVDLLGGDGKGEPNVRRGPRFAAYYSAAAALGDILTDRSRFPIKAGDFYMHVEMPRVSLAEAARDLFANRLLFVDDPRGEIASLRPVKGGVVVAFKAVRATVPNWVSKPTGRIARIEPDGRVVYGYDLVLRGMQMVTTQEPPLFVPAPVATGLAVGQTATFAGDGGRDGRPRNGLPKEVYSGERLVVWYGVTL